MLWNWQNVYMSVFSLLLLLLCLLLFLLLLLLLLSPLLLLLPYRVLARRGDRLPEVTYPELYNPVRGPVYVLHGCILIRIALYLLNKLSHFNQIWVYTNVVKRP